MWFRVIFLAAAAVVTLSGLLYSLSIWRAGNRFGAVGTLLLSAGSLALSIYISLYRILTY